MRTVLITGVQGVGKSTVTLLTAQALGLADWDYAELMMQVEPSIRHRDDLQYIAWGDRVQIYRKVERLLAELFSPGDGTETCVLLENHLSIVDETGGIRTFPHEDIRRYNPVGLVVVDAPAEDVLERRRTHRQRNRRIESLAEVAEQQQINHREAALIGKLIGIIPAVSLLEVASLQSHVSAADVRTLLMKLQAPVSIVGELHTHPAILVEMDSALVEQLYRLFQPYSDLEIVELRRHFHREHLTQVRLIALLAESRRAHRLATGAAAVERAIQRRRLELLVLASGLEKAYTRIIKAVVERNGYAGPLMISDLTREELGQAAGVRRAGCVGLLRGSRHAFL